LLSQGETGTILRIGLLALLVGTPLSFLLIPRFGVLGFIVNNLITQAVVTTLYIYWVRKLLKFNMWIGQSVRVYGASFIMGVLVWATLNAFRLGVGISNNGILLGVGFLVGVFSYLLLLPFMGAIESTEVDNLRVIFAKLGPLTPILNIPFVIIDRMINIRNRINAGWTTHT